MAYLIGYDRKQVTIFQQCIDELIPEDAEVRIIDTLIDGMNLADLGFSSGRSSLEGRPAYAPGDLLKLYVYGYLNRVRTSRLLEHECKRKVELMWLMQGHTPYPKTSEPKFKKFTKNEQEWGVFSIFTVDRSYTS